MSPSTQGPTTVPPSLSERRDLHAPSYQQIAAPSTGYLAQALFQSVAGRLPKAASILDIACGGGELARAAALHTLAEVAGSGRCGQVVAADFSAQMVARTRQLLEATCPLADVRCEVHDGQALGFDAGSFDAALSAFGIFLFPDRMAAWREAARVLRPGGWFATAVWRGPEHKALAREQVAPILLALPASMCEAMPRPPWLEVSTAEGLTREVATAGFTDVEVSVFDAVFTATTPRAMWALALQNPRAAAIRRTGAAETAGRRTGGAVGLRATRRWARSTAELRLFVPLPCRASCLRPNALLMVTKAGEGRNR